MKHAISLCIDDESELIGLCGSVVVKTNNDKAISCFNFNRDQLKTKNTLYVGLGGQGVLINEERYRECALEVVRENLNNGGPFKYEEWCRCTNCNYRQALFIPRNYCPRCGYKFVETIYKEVKGD